MVGAYGQDDRICAYTALMAEIDTKNPTYTTMTILTDKEEIGSEGNTGLNSNYVGDYITYLAELEGVTQRRCSATRSAYPLMLMQLTIRHLLLYMIH